MNTHRCPPPPPVSKHRGSYDRSTWLYVCAGAYALPVPVLVTSRFLTPTHPGFLPKAFLWLPVKGLSPWWAMCLPLLDKDGLWAL